MKIWHEDTESTVDTPEDLQHFVDAVIAARVGTIMLWPEDADYPQLQAFVAGALGSLYFTPDAEAAGHVATGMTPEGCPDMVHFQWGSEPSGDDYDVPSHLVIPADVACNGLFEFLDSSDRPSSTEWLEL